MYSLISNSFFVTHLSSLKIKPIYETYNKRTEIFNDEHVVHTHIHLYT
jgi:hypothetical protein